MRPGERFEQSRVGQALLTIAMLVLIVCVVAWNLPAGKAHDETNEYTAPVVQALGFEQDWALFAPVPRDQSVGVYAEITLRNGTDVSWAPPHNGLLVSPYRNYRWQKFVERLRDDSYSGLWEPTAEWLVRTHGGPSKVSMIELIRTWRPAVTPGSGATRGPTYHYTFYTYEVPK